MSLYISLPHVRKENLFHKLIRVILMFMRKIFVVQCHPQQVDILISKNQALQILYLKHYVYNLNCHG